MCDLMQKRESGWSEPRFTAFAEAVVCVCVHTPRGKIHIIDSVDLAVMVHAV